ncbi:MAG: RIP metalloprotease RseP [Candidatus Eisenbacteria bacterium]|uniref:Zinc metalloprotease n=1 Tax=Eiseniibacteriota bacterium TaxID=2212470 RepID=A0A538U841_UNCEI|nr:MAG: RIP metalloprotease RseP [Candidatus Eisenbacteria bacterium]
MIQNMILPGVALLGIVIFVHELGHFLAAKWRGVKVLKFSLGFGPAVFRFTRGETEYQLAWIPLGGFVSMAGDTPNEDGSMPTGDENFLSHPWYGRAFIAVAGPAANLVTATLVMIAIGLVGVTYPDFPNILGPLPDTTVAYHMGLREGDRLTAVEGAPVKSWISFFVATRLKSDQDDLAFTAMRGDSSFTMRVTAAARKDFLAGLDRPSNPPVVGTVVVGMPAYKAGVLERDSILAVNGKPVKVWDDLPRTIASQTDRAVVLTVVRAGRVFDLTVTPVDASGVGGTNAGRIGIEPPRVGTYVERYPLGRSLRLGFFATGDLVASVYRGMWLTVSRPLYYREYLGGPMFIAQAASEQARRGVDAYLQFLAMINVAIMAFNLLPIPVLDGGHITLALLQALRGQGISYRTYVRFQKVGLAVIGTLFILILANDPLRWMQRQRALDKAPQEGKVAPTPP